VISWFQRLLFSKFNLYRYIPDVRTFTARSLPPSPPDAPTFSQLQPESVKAGLTHNLNAADPQLESAWSGFTLAPIK
jgi:hypothetical protein